MNRCTLTVLLSAVVISACSDSATPSSATVRETIGDTTFVRATGTGQWGEVNTTEELRIGELDGEDVFTFGMISGLVVDEEGSIYVVDGIAREVRVFDEDGAHVRTFARSGGGPGELQQPSGMAFLPDGRLAVRDFGNSRINLYTRDGQPLGNYAIPANFATSEPMFADRAGNLYTQVLEPGGSGVFRTGIARIDSTGAMRDTLVRPQSADIPFLTAERVSPQGSSRSAQLVPFWPSQMTTLSRDGRIVSGRGDRYSISFGQPDGTSLRFERDAEAVPVQPAEADAARERATRNLQNVDPDWRWNGPQMPATKPLFRALFVDEEDRLWVQLSRPARRLPPDPQAKPDARGRMPVESWREELAWDVWDHDGEFLGTVVFPETFELRAARGMHVWGTVRDEYDVQYVTRLRIDA